MWALALRTGASEAAILDAYDRGAILRTHVLRPTWHFVAAEDLAPLQALTAERVRPLLRAVDPKLGWDVERLARGHHVLRRELDGAARTREELALALKQARLPHAGTALVHVLMHAELDAMICSGPRQGKKHTYALVDARVRPGKIGTRDELLADLARRYFATRGPAQAKDFAWWSRLTMTEVRRAIELAGSKRTVVDGEPHFHAEPPVVPGDGASALRLLPSYDELVVAYRDRSALVPDPTVASRLDEREFLVGRSLIVRGGVVHGAWRRTLAKREVALELELLAPPSAGERAALDAEVERYGAFLGLRARCTLAVAKKSARARA